MGIFRLCVTISLFGLELGDNMFICAVLGLSWVHFAESVIYAFL